jgi:hypothetical protein
MSIRWKSDQAHLKSFSDPPTVFRTKGHCRLTSCCRRTNKSPLRHTVCCLQIPLDVSNWEAPEKLAVLTVQVRPAIIEQYCCESPRRGFVVLEDKVNLARKSGRPFTRRADRITDEKMTPFVCGWVNLHRSFRSKLVTVSTKPHRGDRRVQDSGESQ